MQGKDLKWIESAIDVFAQTAEKDGEYWRATYTAEDRRGVELLGKWMQEKGFSTYFDGVGNLFGRIPGCSSEVVLCGSHRDTVKNGGRYDGALGLLAAIEAAYSLYGEHGVPEKTVEVAALCEEEASRFLSGYVGSRALIGALDRQSLEERDADGVSLGEAMKRAGYLSGSLPQARRDVERFVELHIEQGAVLEHGGHDIGIVTGIVGLCSGHIEFFGQQNHAGTTPMSLREDPVPAAAAFIGKMTAWATSKNDGAACTFGNITVSPGKSNVIANAVDITFDIRSQSPALLDEAMALLDEAASTSGGKVRLRYSSRDLPAAMDAGGISALERIAEQKGLKYKLMPSGAGHDSQIIAQRIKTNMIFVPSRGGVSHSPLEYTDAESIGRGYEILKQFLYESAWRKGEENEG